MDLEKGLNNKLSMCPVMCDGKVSFRKDKYKRTQTHKYTRKMKRTPNNYIIEFQEAGGGLAEHYAAAPKSDMTMKSRTLTHISVTHKICQG